MKREKLVINGQAFYKRISYKNSFGERRNIQRFLSIDQATGSKTFYSSKEWNEILSIEWEAGRTKDDADYNFTLTVNI